MRNPSITTAGMSGERPYDPAAERQPPRQCCQQLQQQPTKDNAQADPPNGMHSMPRRAFPDYAHHDWEDEQGGREPEVLHDPGYAGEVANKPDDGEAIAGEEDQPLMNLRTAAIDDRGGEEPREHDHVEERRRHEDRRFVQ